MRRAADELDAVLRGQRARTVWFRFPRLAAAGKRLSGRAVAGVEARGKALLVHFEGAESVYTHNQLYGKWLLGPAGQRPDTSRELRLAIETDRHAALLYSASDIAVWPTAELASHPYLRRLGIELLAPDTTFEAVLGQVAAPRHARRSLGALLLDQGFLAGVGNYLRSEILFVARLHPARRAGELGAGELRRLARAALAITRRAYRTGGVTNTPSAAARLRRAGLPFGQYRHYVFDRTDPRCDACGGATIRRIVDSGRQLYLCTTCQSAPGGRP